MPIKTVDVATLRNWMTNGESVVVDVREPAEHASENIPGAILLPLGSITKSALPDSGGKKLVIHCRSGKRSATACEKLVVEDPNLEIHNLQGGIAAWGAAGYEIVKPNNAFLPLDRQVQLAIGLSVLIGSVLSYFVTPMFCLFTGIFGAGLTFAGLSGFCGLAMVMSKMPWNKSASNITSCKMR